MKNKRTLIVLSVAIISGLVSVLIASRWLNQQSSNNTARIAVAANDINLGQRVTPDMFKLTDWPSGSTPPGAIRELAKLDGRVLKTSLLRGEPLLEAKLAPLGTAGGLSAVIAEGHRAITVRVNDVIGVAGFALPGNYVDIIVNTQKEGERSSKESKESKEINISKIVLERILVLAVAQEVSRDDTKPRVVNAVTLEVTPGQAETLDLARSVGTLSLALRNQVDPQPGTTVGATKATLFDDEKPAQGIAAKPVTIAPAPSVRPKATSPKIARRPDTPAAPLEASVTSSPVNACVGVITGLRNSQECY